MLTAYDLACGNVERRDIGNWHLEMYKEHAVYHVRLFFAHKRIAWHSFDKLANARREFHNLLKTEIGV